MAAMKVG
jgi:hypothetical protein